ncbi:MAG: TonB-dependent receptor [Candidatus Didemnitutus sp.]|nr:TonB-dependent receptor [Candidatus Didemnitutus sp.]
MRFWCRPLAALLLAPALGAQTLTLDPLAVTTARTPQAPAQVPFSLQHLRGEKIRSTPALTLDGALRSVPGFGLFRRSDSLTAHPTAQGATLRGLGPSGASRSLVLLDDVPLNDPFGGWVAWSKVPREALASVELLRGGGATAWGNAALGGVIHLRTLPASAGGGRIAASLGSFSTRSAEVMFTQPAARGTLQLTGRDFSTGGFVLVAPEDRGPVDQPAGSRHRWLSARWSQPVGDSAELAFTGRSFTENRGNGTAYQRNSSQENFGSVSLVAQPHRSFAWTALAYGQGQSFASTFSSINAARSAETPASHQFDVPATALGASWTGIWAHTGEDRTSAGVDLRRVRGETREHFMYGAGDFTRLRVAGGTQEFAGLFALHERAPSSAWRATFGARLDGWREHDGHRRETDRATGAALRTEHHADGEGLAFSPSAGLVWSPVADWRVRVAAQSSFRRPTLNELHRPFRVGSVITEANAALETERVVSGEIGAQYAREGISLGAAFFWNEFRDAIGNVTLVRGPGTFPLFGFIPSGGVGRQRLNLERLSVHGLEVSGSWRAVPSLTIETAYLYNEATVRHTTLAPALIGKRLAQVPRHSATAGATWLATRHLTVTARGRLIGRQFEDDENLLLLGTTVTADFGLSYTLTKRGELFLTVENLGNARIETGRSTDGIVSTGTPRNALGGLRWVW